MCGFFYGGSWWRSTVPWRLLRRPPHLLVGAVADGELSALTVVAAICHLEGEDSLHTGASQVGYEIARRLYLDGMIARAVDNGDTVEARKRAQVDVRLGTSPWW